MCLHHYETSFGALQALRLARFVYFYFIDLPEKYSQTLIFAGVCVCASFDIVLFVHSLLVKTQVSDVLFHLCENGITKVFSCFVILGRF